MFTPYEIILEIMMREEITIDGFFYPDSVAVVGVSSASNNMGQIIVANMVNFGYKGRIYPVGPKGGTVLNMEIKKSVTEIPDGVQAAVLLTPAATIPDLLNQCGEKGIRWVVVSSAGFSEFEEERTAMEIQIKETLKRWGMRLIGPNCVGVISTETGACLCFAPLPKVWPSGGVSIVSQSGGVGLEYAHTCCNEGLGINKFISVGNKLDVGETELLEYLIRDPLTKVILMYLESIDNGRALVEIARASNKPVIVHKGNVSPVSSAAARSHTAAILNDDMVVEAAFKQAGIIRVKDKREAITAIKAFNMPLLKGSNLAIITRSGGHGVIAADACAEYNFNLPELPPQLIEEVKKEMRAGVIKPQNPLDLGDVFNVPQYPTYAEHALREPGIDGAVFVMGGSSSEEMEKFLGDMSSVINSTQKPVAISHFFNSSEVGDIDETTLKATLPYYDLTREALKGMAMSRDFYKFVERRNRLRTASEESMARIREEVRVGKTFSISEDPQFPEIAGLLSAYSIQVQPWKVARNEEEAVKCADEMGYPVALKVISSNISHKSDIGGVKLNLASPSSVHQATREIFSAVEKAMPGVTVDGILVQKMAGAGKEIIVGGKSDPSFGPLVMVGLGGIFVEILGDVSTRLAPVNLEEAEEMVEQLKGYRILKGVRGEPPSDLETLYKTIVRLSLLIYEHPEIEQIEINPFLLLPEKEGGVALDARVVTCNSKF